jgi:hypothetical protein
VVFCGVCIVNRVIVAFGFPCRIFFKLSLLDIRKALNCAYWKLIIHSPNGAIQFSCLVIWHANSSSSSVYFTFSFFFTHSFSRSQSFLPHPIHLFLSRASFIIAPAIYAFYFCIFFCNSIAAITNFPVTTFTASTYQAFLTVWISHYNLLLRNKISKP